MTQRIRITLGAIFFCLSSAPALADAISPSIKDDGVIYSEAEPNSSVYGTGQGGELTEASMLRFKGEEKTRRRKYDEAIEMLKKAVQLDPGDPSTHILLARARTAKIMHDKTLPDNESLQKAINEWKLIWHHDADQSEQYEAKMQARMLMRLAKAIEKDKAHHLNTHGEILLKSATKGSDPDFEM
jgi:hypothetical protein